VLKFIIVLTTKFKNLGQKKSFFKVKKYFVGRVFMRIANFKKLWALAV